MIFIAIGVARMTLPFWRKLVWCGKPSLQVFDLESNTTVLLIWSMESPSTKSNCSLELSQIIRYFSTCLASGSTIRSLDNSSLPKRISKTVLLIFVLGVFHQMMGNTSSHFSELSLQSLARHCLKFGWLFLVFQRPEASR